MNEATRSSFDFDIKKFWIDRQEQACSRFMPSTVVGAAAARKIEKRLIGFFGSLVLDSRKFVAMMRVTLPC